MVGSWSLMWCCRPAEPASFGKMSSATLFPLSFLSRLRARRRNAGSGTLAIMLSTVSTRYQSSNIRISLNSAMLSR